MRIVKRYLSPWILGLAVASAATSLHAAGDDLPALIEQLQEADLSKRDALTARIVQQAAETDDNLERWLDVLPKPDALDDPDVAERFRQIRDRVASRIVEQAGQASTISIDAAEIELSELLEQIEQQTGNRVADLRAQWGEPASPIRVEAKFADRPFWPALDEVLDQSGLTTFRFGEGAALGLRSRPPTMAPRVGRAAYGGPFRIEAIRVQAVRDLVDPSGSGLVLMLEVAWEPRIEPIALLQPIQALRITTDAGKRLAVDVPQEQLVVEPPPGSISAELAVPLELPDRSSIEALSVAGQFIAITPARTAEFVVADLAGGEPVEQIEGNLKLVLTQVVERQGLWEFHVRLKLPNDVPGLQSHVGWAYQNVTFLRHQDGETIDHGGFETTSSGPGEIGLAYFFEVPEPIDEYTWVYQSPVNITAIRIDYELETVPLP